MTTLQFDLIIDSVMNSPIKPCFQCTIPLEKKSNICKCLQYDINHTWLTLKRHLQCNYLNLNCIAKAGYAKVYQCKLTNKYSIEYLGNSHVLKRSCLDINGALFFDFIKEFLILNKIKHNNVVYAHTIRSTYSHVEYTMDKANFPLQVISISKEERIEKALNIVHQLAMGVFELHTQARVIHMDIRPSNILVYVNGRICIADLGLCIPLENDSEIFGYETFCQSSQGMFRAPECPRNDQSWKPSIASDIWSVGAILLWLIHSGPCYETQWNTKMIDEYLGQCLDKMMKPYEISNYEKCEEAKTLIRGLCSSDCELRIKVFQKWIQKDYTKRIEEPWITHLLHLKTVCTCASSYIKQEIKIRLNTKFHTLKFEQEVEAWYYALFGARKHDEIENNLILSSNMKNKMTMMINIHSSIRCVMCYYDINIESDNEWCNKTCTLIRNECTPIISCATIKNSLFRINNDANE